VVVHSHWLPGRFGCRHQHSLFVHFISNIIKGRGRLHVVMYAGRERITDLYGITFGPGPFYTDYHVHLAMRNMTAKWKWIPLISGALVVLLAGQTRLHAASSQKSVKVQARQP